MDLKKFEEAVHKFWDEHFKDDSSHSFTMIVVESNKEGLIKSGLIISSKCPVCHSQLLADMIEEHDIQHSNESDPSETQVH